MLRRYPLPVDVYCITVDPANYPRRSCKERRGRNLLEEEPGRVFWDRDLGPLLLGHGKASCIAWGNRDKQTKLVGFISVETDRMSSIVSDTF
jgi:hypothetical protein